jgi:hypothetical protein
MVNGVKFWRLEIGGWRLERRSVKGGGEWLVTSG